MCRCRRCRCLPGDKLVLEAVEHGVEAGALGGAGAAAGDRPARGADTIGAPALEPAAVRDVHVLE